MAKKKKEVVDLKPKVEKITEEELKSIQNIASKFDLYHQEIGVLEGRKHQLLHLISGMQDTMRAEQEKLKEAYGEVDIDIRTGEIKYPENGQSDKKD